MNARSLLLFARLVLAIGLVAPAFSQNKPAVALKKMSEFSTQKERVTYLFELAEAGIFKTMKWQDLEPAFDFGMRKFKEDDGQGQTVIAYLTQQPAPPPPDQIGARQSIGWYVIFKVSSHGVIWRFDISNSHK